MKRQNSGTFAFPKVRCFKNIFPDPVKREDLVVNKNRLSDLSEWLDQSVASSKVLMLLLCGPAGCGKTASVKVLASEKGIQEFEWSTPVDSFNHWDDHWNLDSIRPVKASLKFKDFLLGVGRYSSVMNDTRFSDKKLIVIKDFPTSFLTNPEEFREIIDEYVLKGRSPIVFICTDSPNKKSKDIAYELFSEEFKAKHCIAQLSLLPIPVTSVVKALKRTIQLSGTYVKDDLIKELAQECHGDIRKALNDLRLFSVGSAKAGKNKLEQKKQKKGQKEKNGSKSSHDDDESSGLFHSVGRILYAKRISKDEQGLNNTFCSSAGELIHKPEDIVKQFSHYANQVVTLAHSNYLDIFSSIDCMAKAATYLSDADLLMSEWREKDLLTTVGFSVAVAGLMESNRNPVRRFRPIHGSKWNEDMKVARNNHIQMHALFSDYSASRLNVCLEVIPFLNCMWRAKYKETAIKQCSHGFLPHKTDVMYSTLSKIKSDILNPIQLPRPMESIDEDPPIHISDDSE